MLSLRVVRQLGYSYRALFGWLRPLDYAILMFLEPAAQLAFFALLGGLGPQDTSFYVVGNAVRLMSVSALFGATSVILNERRQGTLSALLATPSAAAETFFGRALLQGVSGVLTGVFALAMGVLLFGLDLRDASVPWLAVTLVATAVSLSGLGLLLANLSLVGTNPNRVLNVAFYGLVVVTGANVPLADLPAAMAAVGRGVPMTHGLEAVRLAVSGEVAGMLPLLGRELLTGAAYGVAGVALFRRAEWRARRTGSLDLV